MCATITQTGFDGHASEYDDGIELNGANRWQEHGHDRLYLPHTEGYIDLANGEVVDLEVKSSPEHPVESWDLRPEDGKIAVVGTRKDGREAVAARIPMEILA